MAGNQLTIKLTEDQQKQIQKATGKTLRELSLDLASQGGLTEEELEKVGSGAAKLSFNRIGT